MARSAVFLFMAACELVKIHHSVRPGCWKKVIKREGINNDEKSVGDIGFNGNN